MVTGTKNCISKSTVSNGSGKSHAEMKVFIRIRPYSNNESIGNLRNVVKVINNYELQFDPKIDDVPFFYHGVKQKMRDIAKKQNKEMNFIFDRIYDQRCTTTDVYNESIKNILPSLLDGYNCSVFVYGPTGTGKTFTMAGNSTNPGIMFLTMQDLFRKIDEVKDSKIFQLAASYVEVYNETVRDLLKPNVRPLQLREDAVNGVIVANVTLEKVVSAEQLLVLLQRGNNNRTQHPTDANAESSRSHAVFQIFLRIQDRSSGQIKVVKITMIDLAGSERGAATNYGGMRFKEGANINRSLLALGNCINKLADGVKHIPYRDSKLTRLLKDSLGGNCQTVMIACVAPTVRSYEDTYNTLKYAMRAKSIKMTLSKNVIKTETDDSYKQIIQDLQDRISDLESEKQKTSVAMGELNSKYDAAQNEIAVLKSLLNKNGKADKKRRVLCDNDEISQRITNINNPLYQLDSNMEPSDKLNGDTERIIELDALIAEMKEHNTYKLMTKYAEYKEGMIREMELDAMEGKPINKTNVLAHLQTRTMDEIIMELADLNDHCRLLLRDHNIDAMMEKHMGIQNMINGFSSNSRMKRKTDYCSLSLDNLKQFKKPCLPIIGSSDNIMSDCEEEKNITYTVNRETYSTIYTSPPELLKRSRTLKRINKKIITTQAEKISTPRVKKSHYNLRACGKVLNKSETP